MVLLIEELEKRLIIKQGGEKFSRGSQTKCKKKERDTQTDPIEIKIDPDQTTDLESTQY